MMNNDWKPDSLWNHVQVWNQYPIDKRYINIISIKGSIFLKNRHFIIQKRLNKLIYCINVIIKCGIWQPVKCQLVSFLKWNDFLSYIWINVVNINSEMFLWRLQNVSQNFTLIIKLHIFWAFENRISRNHVLIVSKTELLVLFIWFCFQILLCRMHCYSIRCFFAWH